MIATLQKMGNFFAIPGKNIKVQINKKKQLIVLKTISSSSLTECLLYPQKFIPY
jgi:hypothetical protein